MGIHLPLTFQARFLLCMDSLLLSSVHQKAAPMPSLVPRPSDWKEVKGIREGLVSTACTCAVIMQILTNPITYVTI